MNRTLLYLHLGLGDHLLFNGLVRAYAKKYQAIGIFCKSHNLESVRFMFHDLPKVRVIEVQKGDISARRFIAINRILNRMSLGVLGFSDVFIFGFQFLDRSSPEPFDRQIYALANLSPKEKYEKFFVQRNYARERALFNEMYPGSEYIFLHEDVSRGYVIDRTKIHSRLPIVSSAEHRTDNIFDYGTILDKAKEIHTIDSSFLSLVDLLPNSTTNRQIYLHRYARTDGWTPSLRKDWIIIE